MFTVKPAHKTMRIKQQNSSSLFQHTIDGLKICTDITGIVNLETPILLNWIKLLSRKVLTWLALQYGMIFWYSAIGVRLGSW